MGLFKKDKTESRAAPPQLRAARAHPFDGLSRYVPLRRGEFRLYRTLREAVPVIDAAIIKFIRLSGGFHAECGNAEASSKLDEFLRTVDPGRAQRGINSFYDAYADSLLTCGGAVGEIVPNDDRRGIAAILCGDINSIEISEGQSPLDFKLCRAGVFSEPIPFKCPELLVYTALNPEPDYPYGVSVLRSMPFVSDILLKIFQSIGTNFERVGNVRFAVTCKPPENSDGATPQQRAQQVASAWSDAMASTRTGSVRDFVAVGDVSVKVIGAENQIPDTSVPVRQMLEQIIARTGIPPFLLGLSWSSTERMSSQQADILTSEIAAFRRTLTPALEHICGTWLRYNGYGCGVKIVWDDVNLQDSVEEARARLWNAQAALAEKSAAEENK